VGDQAAVLAVLQPFEQVPFGLSQHPAEGRHHWAARFAVGVQRFFVRAQCVKDVLEVGFFRAVPTPTICQNASIFFGGAFGSNFDRSYSYR
jgi:hypothetical protein